MPHLQPLCCRPRHRPRRASCPSGRHLVLALRSRCGQGRFWAVNSPIHVSKGGSVSWTQNRVENITVSAESVQAFVISRLVVAAASQLVLKSLFPPFCSHHSPALRIPVMVNYLQDKLQTPSLGISCIL